jgi:DNA topoisomerase-2
MGHTRTGVVRKRVSTILGGKHVDYVLNQITKKASDLINKRNKDANVKPQHVKDKLFLTQEYDPEPRLQRPDEGDSGHAGDEVPEEDRSFGQVRGRPKEHRHLQAGQFSGVNPTSRKKKTDGAKKNIVRVPKLTTNWAGTPKSKQCTLILTEGDSAKTMAISGLSVVGRDKFGLSTARQTSTSAMSAGKIADNEEITNIKRS